MRHTNEKRIGLMASRIAFLGGYFQRTGTSPYDLRRMVLDDSPTVLDASSTRLSSAARSTVGA